MGNSNRDAQEADEVPEPREELGKGSMPCVEVVNSRSTTLDDVGDDPPSADPSFVFQGTSKDIFDKKKYDVDSKYHVQKHGLAIVVPPATHRWEYQILEEPMVEGIIEEYEDDDGVSYLVRFVDGTEDEVSSFYFTHHPARTCVDYTSGLSSPSSSHFILRSFSFLLPVSTSTPQRSTPILFHMTLQI